MLLTQKRVCAKEGESISTVKRRERRGVQVYFGTIRKEYIRPSKSPQIVLVFFVGKKDRKK